MAKKVIALLLAGVLCISVVACGSDSTNEESKSVAETEVETSVDEEPEENVEDTSEEETRTAYTGSSPYADDEAWVNYDEMSFSYYGEKFILGEATLQDLIDAGVPFNKDDIDEVDTEEIWTFALYGGIRVDISDSLTAQVFVINDGSDSQVVANCVVAGITITESDPLGETWGKQQDLVFPFPYDMTITDLTEKCGEPTMIRGEEENGGNYVYIVSNEKFGGNKGYRFTFENGALTELQMMLTNVY